MEEVNKTAEIPNAGNDGENVDVNTENTANVGSEEVSKKKSNLRGRWKRPNNATAKNQDNKQSSSAMTELTENTQATTAEKPQNKPYNQNLRTKQNDAGRPKFKDSNAKSYRFSDERRSSNQNKPVVQEKDEKPASCCLLGGIKNLFCKLFGKKNKNQTCSITELNDSRPKKKYYNKNKSYSKRPNNKSYKKPNNNN